VNESSWNLVIPVLIIGLAVGAAWVVLWRRKRSRATKSSDRDRQLLLVDLEARQATLYDQLREASGEEQEALELAAARNLMAIEQAGGKRHEAARQEDSSAGTEASVAPPSERPMPPSRRPSPLVGFIGGVACAALIGVLVLWAQRDAQPRPDDGMGGPRAPVAGEEAHPEGPPMSEREREALAQLALAIENDPTDLMARKQYAVGLLATGRFMPAFEQAEILLGSDPNDPDGLYVKGMVRMRMGQETEARALLDQVLIDYPDHVPALTALGVLALRTGGLPAAEEYWTQALEHSGGQNPEIERLRAAAREQFAATAGGQGATPMAGAPSEQAATRPGPAAAPQAQPSAPSYTLQLELAAGASPAPSAVLFVALRSGPGGPPAAVRRIANPRFPMTVTLSAADTMMGQPLPEEGTVSVRLDIDGSVSTRDDSEPAADAEMRVGETARLTLE